MPDTLAAVLGKSDRLADRMLKLRSSLTEIATILGGPWPVDGKGGNPLAMPEAIAPRLSIMLDEHHAHLTELEAIADRIRTSIGMGQG